MVLMCGVFVYVMFTVVPPMPADSRSAAWAAASHCLPSRAAISIKEIMV